MSAQVDVLAITQEMRARLVNKRMSPTLIAWANRIDAAVAALIAERDALLEEVAALRQQPAPVVDDAMVSRATAAYNGIWESTTHREAMRAALTAALARAQGVQS